MYLYICTYTIPYGGNNYSVNFCHIDEKVAQNGVHDVVNLFLNPEKKDLKRLGKYGSKL